MIDESSRTVYVDASVFITLSAIEYHGLLADLEGSIVVPRAVAEEISDEPATGHLERARESWLAVPDERIRETDPERYRHAASHLGRDLDGGLDGDVALLAFGLRERSDPATDAVIVTDDRPLRETCKALRIDVSGSIGVLVIAVERDVLDESTAKDALLAMDEVGARLSARLLRRAERSIEDAADE